MKCVGVQYVEAMKEFKRKKIQLKRTVHICFVPGMKDTSDYQISF